MITEKMKKYGGWILIKNQPYFINGIIRKFKPKKCLEIGVARGGSSIIILNALKDIQDSFLISLDLNTITKEGHKIGENVKKFFPELTSNKKWQLFTGEMPHKFLDKLGLKFDFLFLDTVHLTPGELINIIEALPFLEENAIIIMHDIMFHLPTNKYYNPREVKFHPSQIYLFTSLAGCKIIIEDENKGAENIGAVFLYSNKEKYYLNYFLLLLTPWEYMPKKSQIEELRSFILKYYKNEIFLLLFNRAVKENEIYINNFKNVYNKAFKKN
jgi:predicted O-methyltransferase YrrM